MRIALKALFAGALIILAGGLAQAQNTFQSTSHSTSLLAGVSSSISSGDLTVTCSTESTPAIIAAADARLSSPDGAVFTIGQLQVTVRYFNGSNALLGAINLPTAPTIGDLPLIASALFYATSLTTPMTVSTEDLTGAAQVTIRATAIVQNTTAAAHNATLVIDLLSSTTGCM